MVWISKIYSIPHPNTPVCRLSAGFDSPIDLIYNFISGSGFIRHEPQNYNKAGQTIMADLQNNHTNKSPGKIYSLEEMSVISENLRKSGKTVVFTNGCFDILHLGHIRYLRQAKAFGDVLVIGVNTDSSVKDYKGDLRPIVPEDERAELLAALEMVDYVVKFSERTPENIISALKPDIQVKGGDYTPDQLPEAKVVYSYGGKVEIVPFVKGKATTGIIEKILKVYGSK